jgi:hypothetical protein
LSGLAYWLDIINSTKEGRAMRKNNNFVSLTTRVPPKTFLAISKLSKEHSLTESAYLRQMLLSQPCISKIDISANEVEELMLTLRKRTKKSRKSWIKRIFGK